MYVSPEPKPERAARRIMASRVIGLLLCAAVSPVGVGSCTGAEDPALERQLAGGLVEARSGSSLAGFVTVKRRAGVVKLFLNVVNAPPGEHGVHLHQTGDCTAADASSAGPHWNPENHQHGGPADAAHLGDLGNLHVDETGRGLLTITSPAWSLGDGTEYDILGRALVVHERADDLLTQPAGNSGARIGCGVIH
jgi:Cu-Zn family superoxide dismutase